MLLAVVASAILGKHLWSRLPVLLWHERQHLSGTAHRARVAAIR
jgi:hypothetical protein